MASFVKLVRRSQTLSGNHPEPERNFFENQCRVLGEQVSIAKEISSDHAFCSRCALPELQRVIKLGESLIEGCQTETCAHKAYLRQDERIKAFEETLKEILWCMSVVFYSHKRRITSRNPSILPLLDEFPQAVLGAKEQYLMQKAAVADETVLRDALRLWIKRHKCSIEECGRPQKLSRALCLAVQILDRSVSNGEGGASRGLAGESVEGDQKSLLWTTVQKSLEDVVQIGKGSFGTVFETKWLGDTYAKKEFDIHCKDFADEVNALAKLNHPHIVKMYAACSKSCIPCFFIMEKVAYNLRTLMNWRMNQLGVNPPFSISAGIDLMLQLSEAMSYMNSQGMVHRDLKAENVLVKPVDDDSELCQEGFVIAKLADFGLAKLKNEVTVSRMTRNTGTRRWMAPEVFGAHPDDEENLLLKVFPRKADVYSYGIVCSEILTGNVPYYNVSYKPRELYKLITDPGNPLRPELPQRCPIILASLIRKCWHTDPVERPTFDEISTTLRFVKGLLMIRGGSDLVHFGSAGWRMIRARLGKGSFSTDTVQVGLQLDVWEQHPASPGLLDEDLEQQRECESASKAQIAELKEKLEETKHARDVLEKQLFEANQRDAELLRLKDETTKQESELMKLREETGKLLDEIVQMVDEKEYTLLSIEHLEEDKHELEERLRGNSDVVAAEKVKLLRKIDDLEDELDHARNLCEERRLRIESMDIDELPTLHSQIELMTTLDEKARIQIAELKEKLDETKHARDGLEKPLVEAEQRELENSIQVAGESKSAAEELQRLKFELDNHMLGKSDNEQLASQLESEKKILEQKVAQVEEEKREALERISTLEMSLKDVTQAKTDIEDELEIVRVTMYREAEDNETAQADYRSKIEELAEQVSTLTSAKSNLETHVAQSETKINETEHLLHVTEVMLKVLNEELEQKRKFESVAKRVESISDENTVLEVKLASLQEQNAQMSEQISELTKKVEGLEKEKEQLLNELEVYDKEISKLEAQLEEADVAVIEKKRLEREVKGLKFELSKEKSEVERVQAEMEELSKIGQDASLRIIDMEEAHNDLEASYAALWEDKKRASAKASELGEEILTLDTECKELKQRFGEMNFKYLEIVAERDELQQEKRNLRSK